MKQLPKSTRAFVSVIPLMVLLLGVTIHTDRPNPGSYLFGGQPLVQENSPSIARGNFSPSVWRESLTIGRLIAQAADKKEWTEEKIQDLSLHIVLKSREYKVSPLLVLSLIHVESRFRTQAVSPKGAVGLMQLMPSTAQELAIEMGVDWSPESLVDPKTNIDLALNYLVQLRTRFAMENDAHLLTAYNMGPAAVQKRIRNGADLPLGYYQKVMETMAVYRQDPSLPKKLKRESLWL